MENIQEQKANCTVAMKQTPGTTVHYFLTPVDDLSTLINEKANRLFQQLNALDVQQTGISEAGKYYFSKHHTGKRLFFSIESSADIIYSSVKRTGKPLADINFTDYGAGLGTLFLLAGLVGFKKVFYNDLFPEWSDNAKIISNKLNIPITDFITGDIDVMIDYGKTNSIYFDIVASRNVVEHIYDLRSFYAKLNRSQLTGLCYATTTANFHNIAMRLKHYREHIKLEKQYFRKQREDYIRELVPGISEPDIAELVRLTRGRAFNDLTNAVNSYLAKQPIPEVEFLRTNTCDCRNGVWAEHIISRREYRSIIEGAGFSTDYTAGFWDTNYTFAIVNIFTKLFNKLIKLLGKKGYWLSPYVNVVAYTKKQ